MKTGSGTRIIVLSSPGCSLGGCGRAWWAPSATVCYRIDSSQPSSLQTSFKGKYTSRLVLWDELLPFPPFLHQWLCHQLLHGLFLATVPWVLQWPTLFMMTGVWIRMGVSVFGQPSETRFVDSCPSEVTCQHLGVASGSALSSTHSIHVGGKQFASALTDRWHFIQSIETADILEVYLSPGDPFSSSNGPIHPRCAECVGWRPVSPQGVVCWLNSLIGDSPFFDSSVWQPREGPVHIISVSSPLTILTCLVQT